LGAGAVELDAGRYAEGAIAADGEDDSAVPGDEAGAIGELREAGAEGVSVVDAGFIGALDGDAGGPVAPVAAADIIALVDAPDPAGVVQGNSQTERKCVSRTGARVSRARSSMLKGMKKV
jgi:hypothetical protein